MFVLQVVWNPKCINRERNDQFITISNTKISMIKLIIFDWDDVITLGAKEGYFKCYHETLVELGVELDSEEERKRILENWGRTVKTELLGLLKEQPELIKQAEEAYERVLHGNTYVELLRVVPGAQDLLLRLKERYVLAVVTGANPQILKEKVIPKFKIPEVFSNIISGYEIEPAKQKPHPFAIEKLLEEHNISTEEAIYVGDAGNDVQMAKNAGVEPVVVLTGNLTREEAEELGVKHIIPDVTHLEKVLEELNK